MSGEEDKIKQELRKGGIQLWRPPYYGVATSDDAQRRCAHDWRYLGNGTRCGSHGAPILAASIRTAFLSRLAVPARHVVQYVVRTVGTYF